VRVAIQSWALLVEAYRELNSRRLFWITLALSGLVVAAFAAVGVSDRGFTVLGWEFESTVLNARMLPPAAFYKMLFVSLGIGLWLTWAATILALVSTAGLIPDFIASGAVELVLSKPLSRVRLFLTKYLLGLLFAALQVAVFAAASFLVIGLRGGEWAPGVFLAVPLVVVFFSYLFSICVLLGLLTRSTIAALLLTLLVWCGLSLVQTAGTLIATFATANELRLETLPEQVERMERAERSRLEQPRAEGQPAADAATAPTAAELDAASPRLRERREDLRRAERDAGAWRMAARITDGLLAVLPKTQQTIALLERRLVSATAADEAVVQEDDGPDIGPLKGVDRRGLQRRMRDKLAASPAWWVIGTSIAFEAVVLAIAAWIFSRRDF
jgi:ABC-type transport system involved in multi-copper enzyme maturation permease subunit